MMVRVVDIFVVEPVEAESTMDVVGTALKVEVVRYHIVVVEEYSDKVVDSLLVVAHENGLVPVGSILVVEVDCIADIAVGVVLAVVDSAAMPVVVALVVVVEEAVCMKPYIDSAALAEDTFCSHYYDGSDDWIESYDVAVADRIVEAWVEEANRPCL